MEIQTLFWVLAITGGFLLAGFVVAAVGRWLQHTIRRRRYRREELASRPHRLQTQRVHAAVGPEEAAAIQRHAQQAAREALRSGRGGEARSPYPQGTREYVLWATSYHLALTELGEEVAAPAQTTP